MHGLHKTVLTAQDSVSLQVSELGPEVTTHPSQSRLNEEVFLS